MLNAQMPKNEQEGHIKKKNQIFISLNNSIDLRNMVAFLKNIDYYFVFKRQAIIVSNFINKILIIYIHLDKSSTMKTIQFPAKNFYDALQSKKLKNSLKPFLLEFQKMNIPWMFEATLIIFNNLKTKKIEPKTKLASVYTVKYMVETANYFLLQIIQAYLLFPLKEIAMFDPQKQDVARGDIYFTNDSTNSQLNQIGYNLIKLCTQIIWVLSLIKPQKLYDLKPTQDPSTFSLTKKQVFNSLKTPPQNFMIIKSSNQIKIQFHKQLQNINDEKLEIFTNFVQGVFLEQLKNNFESQKELDIRRLVLVGDNYLYDLSIEVCVQAFEESSYASVFSSVFEFITSALKTGYLRILILLHDNESISDIISQILNIPDPSKQLSRGIHFLKNKRGSPEQKQKAYTLFLKNLQFWAKTDAGKFFTNPTKPSSISYYYQYLKNTKKYLFPKNPDLRKQIQEFEKNKKNCQDMNRIFLQEIEKQIKEENKIPEIAGMKISDNWSIISIESRQSNMESERSEKKLSEKKYSQKSMSQTQKKEIPITKDAVKSEIMLLRKIIINLGLKQENLPQNFEYLTLSSEGLQTKITEITDGTNQQLQELMNIYFDTVDAINQLNNLYNTYKTAKINFSEFKKKAKSTEQKYHIVVENIPEEKIQTKTKLKESQKKQQSTIKMQEKQEIETPYKKLSDTEQVKAEQITKPEKKMEESYIKSVNSIQSSSQNNQYIPLTLEPKNPQPRDTGKGSKSSRILQLQKKLSEKSNSQRSQKSEKGSFHVLPKGQEIDFQVSQIQKNSRVSSKSNRSIRNRETNFLLNNLSPTIVNVGEEVAYYQEQNRSVFSKRKLQMPERPYVFDENQNLMTPHRKYRENGSHIKLKSPFRQQSEKSVQNFHQNIPIDEEFDYDDIIQEPKLMPLETSYHQRTREWPNSPINNFKDVIGKQKQIKTGFSKKQKMFWLTSESQSIMKNANGNNQRSRITLKISVPQILQQRTKMHDTEIKILEEDRDRRIRELKQKLRRVENEKSSISGKLKQKQNEIKSLKEQSEVESKFSVVQEQLNFIEDRDFVMKKLNAAGIYSRGRDRSVSDKKNRSLSKGKGYQALKKKGTLLDTSRFDKYFVEFESEKQKKMHLKSKQLLHKDEIIEIGCMGCLQKDSYTVFCFITPQQDILLQRVELQTDENISVKHTFLTSISIQKQKQYKIQFLIHLESVPYEIPHVRFSYRLRGKIEVLRVFLPVGIHKFFRITQVSDKIFNQYFESMPVFRGHQIPYSKRALKNIESLQEYLPQIKQIKDDEANSHGQIVYGGQAFFKKVRFLIKICIKPNQFLYLQIANHQKDKTDTYKETTQFYLATLNHFLMKNTSLY